ncbi:MAG: ABC transporter substrate-binding protein, partial [Rhodospirillaceae bacterium]|nr:ABC transporter substrate-binding protein [Rhodospirillaceae bacterium]
MGNWNFPSRFLFLPLTVLALIAGPNKSTGADSNASYGIAMHGDLKYGPDFTHFDYADPAALKGGEVRMSAIGTFDNLNPYILKGVAADGLGNVFETLMAPSFDEAFSQYGLIAKTIETPPDRSSVTFTLRQKARFHDGTPITADDVVFSFNTLMEHGHPFYRSYFSSVDKIERLAERKVKFTFTPGDNRELPLIIGNGLPILPKTYWAGKDFTKTTLDPPMGSGPYKIDSVDPGRAITYHR